MKIKLRQLRDDLGLTQKEMANVFRITQSFLSNIERGVSSLPDERIQYLKETYPDVNLDDYVESPTPVTKSNSDNADSHVEYNSTELLESLHKERIDLLSRLEEKSKKIEDYADKVLQLQHEIYRLKVLLLKNGIQFGED